MNMKNPGFYCITFIEKHNSTRPAQPCITQCNKCMDRIIDHHINKKLSAAAYIDKPIKKIGCTLQHRHTGAFTICDEETINNPDWIHYDDRAIKY